MFTCCLSCVQQQLQLEMLKLLCFTCRLSSRSPGMPVRSLKVGPPKSLSMLAVVSVPWVLLRVVLKDPLPLCNGRLLVCFPCMTHLVTTPRRLLRDVLRRYEQHPKHCWCLRHMWSVLADIRCSARGLSTPVALLPFCIWILICAFELSCSAAPDSLTPFLAMQGLLVKMITGDQALIGRETAKQLGMGHNIFNTEVLLKVMDV